MYKDGCEKIASLILEEDRGWTLVYNAGNDTELLDAVTEKDAKREAKKF